jgi:hypothetical protein
MKTHLSNIYLRTKCQTIEISGKLRKRAGKLVKSINRYFPVYLVLYCRVLLIIRYINSKE